MKQIKFAIVALLAGSTILGTYRAYAVPKTVDGIVTDSMCTKKHMMPGKPDADCVKECVKDGATYVLVSGDKTYTLGGKAAVLAPFAGKHVVVEGDLTQTTINVSKIHEATSSSHAGMKM